MKKTRVSAEKVDTLTWLVEQLSNSLSETRSRQTRLAEVLELSLTSIGQNLAASEARVEEILDERLSRFFEARDKQSEPSGKELKALSAQFEAETEQNTKAFREFRASLEAMERTLALTETRVEERLNDCLNRLEQAQDRKTEASDETLGAIAARFDVETERNENALSELRATMEAMERTLTSSEARVEERLDEQLSRFEQAREKETEADNATLNALSAKLNAETERNENALSHLRTMLEAMERTLASSEARVEERLDDRLDRFEQARGKESEASNETLGAIAARLDVETERNENALSDLRASLEIMERNFAKLESQIADAMKGGLSSYGPAKKKDAEALRGIVEDLIKQGSFREAIELHWNKKST